MFFERKNGNFMNYTGNRPILVISLELILRDDWNELKDGFSDHVDMPGEHPSAMKRRYSPGFVKEIEDMGYQMMILSDAVAKFKVADAMNLPLDRIEMPGVPTSNFDHLLTYLENKGNRRPILVCLHNVGKTRLQTLAPAKRKIFPFTAILTNSKQGLLPEDLEYMRKFAENPSHYSDGEVKELMPAQTTGV